MARTKQVGKRKRRRITLPVLGAAGASLAMVGGTSATAPTANVPSQATEPRPVITLDEEEISDVSLATFYIFDKENAKLGEGLKLAARGCGGCGGCAARGCGGCAGCAVRGCRGCGCGGCVGGGFASCAGCGGGCGTCWVWTPRGWAIVC